ncbi:MAG TPA: hypothetical protein DCM62_07305, partial [Bacteroidales bacterium]|nr:hypothetical protein [Bacteroidales bacterium]
ADNALGNPLFSNQPESGVISTANNPETSNGTNTDLAVIITKTTSTMPKRIVTSLAYNGSFTFIL